MQILFLKMRSEFTKTRNFKRKSQFIFSLGRGLAPPQTLPPVDPTPLLQPNLLDAPLRPPEIQPDSSVGLNMKIS